MPVSCVHSRRTKQVKCSVMNLVILRLFSWKSLWFPVPLSPSACCNVTDLGVKRHSRQDKQITQKHQEARWYSLKTNFMRKNLQLSRGNLEILSLNLHVYSLLLLTLPAWAENNKLTYNTIFSFYKQTKQRCVEKMCLFNSDMYTLTNQLLLCSSSFKLLYCNQTSKPNSRTEVTLQK